MKIEEAVICHLTTSETVKKAYDLGLNSKLFHIPLNREVFEFILEYWTDSSRDMAPTAEVIATEFPQFKCVDSEESLDWLIGELKNRFLLTGIQETLEATAELAVKGDLPAALHKMSNGAFDISMATADRKSFSNLIENAEDRQARYTERALFDGRFKGASLGLPEVDEFIFGIHPGEICTFVGSPGAGKTWSVVMAALAGLKAGLDPYIFTLELSRQDIEDRLDALAAGVSYEALYRGKLSPEDAEKLRRSQEDMKQYGNLYIEAPNEDERTVQSILNKARLKGSKYVIIDQLSFIKGKRERYSTPKERITEIMHDLHVSIGEGSDEPLSVLLAVQFNREQRKTGRTEMHNIADATEIEQFSDLSFGLNQTDEMRANKAMELTLMKFRRGPKAKWMLNWDLGEKIGISVLQEMGFGDE